MRPYRRTISGFARSTVSRFAEATAAPLYMYAARTGGARAT
jgi:hypothetical protein